MPFQPAQSPGTWGFGLWNDPFSISLGLRGSPSRLPTLPNACWFFHASAENHLSFQNHLPGNGFLAQTFASPVIPALLLAPAAITLPFLGIRTVARALRHIAGNLIREDATHLSVDYTQWHEYQLGWHPKRVEWAIDGIPVYESPVSPKGPLGIVIWVDNQYMSWQPDGSLQAGNLAGATASMEIQEIILE